MANDVQFRLYLWPHRALYFGRSPDNQPHRHYAAQICISLDQPLAFRDAEDGNWTTAGAVQLPPDCSHQIRAGSARLLVIYLEPESDDYAGLLARAPTIDDAGSARVLAIDGAALAALRDQYEHGTPPDAAWSACAAALSLTEHMSPANRRDPRIQSVIATIRRHAEAPLPANRLASAVHLSSSRLAHLFRQQVGVPIRRYIVWARLRMVIERALGGATLTEAAHAAGFADAAHMSNSFRQMFGFAPSALFAAEIPKDVVIVDA